MWRWTHFRPAYQTIRGRVMASEGARPRNPEASCISVSCQPLFWPLARLAAPSFGGTTFILVWGAVFVRNGAEWARILGKKPGSPHRSGGSADFFYALLPSAFGAAVAQFAGAGWAGGLFFCFATVWGADVGAYFAGRAIGGPKLAPSISPKQDTGQGFCGGLVTATLCGSSCSGIAGRCPSPMHAVRGVSLAACFRRVDLSNPFSSESIGAQGFRPSHSRTWRFHGST